mgnify:CR=1 FL=1
MITIYTTDTIASLYDVRRHDLSPLSKACAQESLFGGTVEDVQKCNEDTIGFSSPCSYVIHPVVVY